MVSLQVCKLMLNMSDASCDDSGGREKITMAMQWRRFGLWVETYGGEIFCLSKFDWWVDFNGVTDKCSGLAAKIRELKSSNKGIDKIFQ